MIYILRQTSVLGWEAKEHASMAQEWMMIMSGLLVHPEPAAAASATMLDLELVEH
jgi:hypothetical protein